MKTRLVRERMASGLKWGCPKIGFGAKSSFKSGMSSHNKPSKGSAAVGCKPIDPSVLGVTPRSPEGNILLFPSNSLFPTSLFFEGLGKLPGTVVLGLWVCCDPENEAGEVGSGGEGALPIGVATLLGLMEGEGFASISSSTLDRAMERQWMSKTSHYFVSSGDVVVDKMMVMQDNKCIL